MLVLALAAGLPGCRKLRRAPAVSHAAEGVASLTGLWWARTGDLPDGVRAQVWLDAWGDRLRGTSTAPPWNTTIDGRVTDREHVTVLLHERGFTAAIGGRERSVRFTRSPDGTRLTGTDSEGHAVDWIRAPRGESSPRAGTWMAHWTGLPFGLGVEVRMTRGEDGRWHGIYQYDGTGGRRDGSFEADHDGRVFALRWHEFAADGSAAHGAGRLVGTAFGLRGAFGIDGHDEALGEWVMEPLTN